MNSYLCLPLIVLFLVLVNPVQQLQKKCIHLCRSECVAGASESVLGQLLLPAQSLRQLQVAYRAPKVRQLAPLDY